MGTIALLNGIAPGDIASVSGVAAADIAKFSGEDWPAGGSDPFFADVVFLGSTSNTDDSSYAHTVTPETSGPTTDTVNYQYPPSSMATGSTGQACIVADAAELRMGTDDFIIEVFAKTSNNGGNQYYEFYQKAPENTAGSLQLALNARWAYFRTNGTTDIEVDLGLNTNWKYVAYVREGTNKRIYYASTPGGTATQVASHASGSFNNNNTGNLILYSSSSDVNFCYIGNMHIRVTKGNLRGITGGSSYTSPTSFPTS